MLMAIYFTKGACNKINHFIVAIIIVLMMLGMASVQYIFALALICQVHHINSEYVDEKNYVYIFLHP